MHSLALNGARGAIKWGYHTVADVDRWTVGRDDAQALRLSGSVGFVNTFRLSQRPLVFEAPHAKGAWRWELFDLQIRDGALSARLGPKE